MKICFICSEYPPTTHGGIGVFVKTLAQNLTRRGHTARVIGYDRHVRRDVRQVEDGIEIVRLHNPFQRYSRSRYRKYVWNAPMILERWYLSHKTQQMVSRAQTDLIESYEWSGPLWYGPTHPLVVRMHGNHSAFAYDPRRNGAFSYYQDPQVSNPYARFEKRNLLMADHLIAVSNSVKEATLNSFAIQNRDARVIWNGIDTTHFRPLGGSREAGMVLYVGAIHRRKGVNDLFAAWRLLWQQLPHAKLYLIGNYYPDVLQELMNMLTPDMRASVQVIGYVPHEELPAWYNRCEVAVFPSHAEALCLTCLEAMACGCAVVMTARTSGPEVITHGESGLLVEPTDTPTLAGMIGDLLTDSHQRQMLGQNARARIEACFDLDKLTLENIEFYESII